LEKILITGAGSYIIESIKNWLSEKTEYDASCLDAKTGAWLLHYSSSYKTIIHVAAIVHKQKKMRSSDYYKVNTEIAHNIAKKTKNQNVKQFDFFSLWLYMEMTLIS
jgi:UDP-glucose 4-epimerase